MKETIEKAFTSHILRYVGIALISGSIVHTGTLGGGVTKYIVFIVAGIIAFVVGTIMEKGKTKINLEYILISVGLAIGVGMVSGGTQHYFDGPIYASFLIPFGLLLGYITYVFLEKRDQLNKKRIVTMTIVSLGLVVILYGIAHTLPVIEDHHGGVHDRSH